MAVYKIKERAYNLANIFSVCIESTEYNINGEEQFSVVGTSTAKEVFYFVSITSKSEALRIFQEICALLE